MTKIARALFASTLAVGALLVGGAEAQTTTTRPKHGCYRVVGADEINIRARPFSKSEVIGTAKRGEIVVKWRGWCTLRGFWCPVEKGGIRGHSDKSYLEPAPCPPSLSRPVNS